NQQPHQPHTLVVCVCWQKLWDRSNEHSVGIQLWLLRYGSTCRLVMKRTGLTCTGHTNTHTSHATHTQPHKPTHTQPPTHTPTHTHTHTHTHTDTHTHTGPVGCSNLLLVNHRR